MNFDRVLPQAVEAEQALLGGLIEAPGRLNEVDHIVNKDHFVRPDHGFLYTLLRTMIADGIGVDIVTVSERIRREGEADRYGGLAYVVQLPNCAPATVNLTYYASLIREKALLRDLILVSTDVADRAFSNPKDVELLLSDAYRNLSRLGEAGSRQSWAQISEVIDDQLTAIETREETEGDVTGNTTGFLDLDKKLAGLHHSDLIVLAARPAMGKTVLALNITQNVALMEGKTVGFFALEMSKDQLVDRMLCGYAMVENNRVRTGNLEEGDWDRLLDASEALRQAKIFIDDTGSMTLSDIMARTRQLKAEHPDLTLIVIDYLQLMSGDDPKQPRQQQIADISRGLKLLAKDLQVTVIALSQLNRGVESRADKRPMVSDLRESGAIEQDADVIMFIYRDEYYNPDSADKGLAEVIIAKQRAGATGTVKLVFQGQFTRFDNFDAQDPIL